MFYLTTYSNTFKIIWCQKYGIGSFQFLEEQSAAITTWAIPFDWQQGILYMYRQVITYHDLC